MPTVIGQHIDSYEIIALLGRGGMAEVYHARQTLRGGVQRDVALKLIDTRLSSLPEFNARFDREAQTLISLSNPHILKAFDYGVYEDSAYLVMELMSGGSLAELLRKETLPYARVNKFVDQIGDALDYAHRRGVIHRDLKPQNVLLDESGNGYLTDFGIVKLLGEHTHLTQSQMVVGTPSYMSPEQGSSQPVDGRSDLYSFGVMLFEMLAGRVPFTADTPVQVLFKHAYEPPPRLTTVRPEAPPAVDQVLAKAMAKAPEDRYQSAAALAVDLKAALNNQPISAPPLPKGSPAPSVPVADGPTEAFIAGPGRPDKASSNPSASPNNRQRLGLGLGALMAIVAIVLIGGVVLLSGRNSVSATPTHINEVLLITTPPQSTPLALAAQISSTPTLSATPTITPLVADTSVPLTVTTPTLPTTGQTSTADSQNTHSAVVVLNPTITPNIVASAEAIRTQQAGNTLTKVVIDLSATATQWTYTPTATVTQPPTATPTQSPTLTPTATVTQSSTWTATATPEQTLGPGSTQTDVNGLSQVYVPAGQFTMGSTNQQAQDAYNAAVKRNSQLSLSDFMAETPAHTVSISHGFWLDQFLVTNGAYQKFVEAGGYANNAYWSADGLKWRQANAISGPETGCVDLSNQPDQPRVCISYYEAEAYAHWRGGRLPTEAEWEYAARSPKNFIYPWGNTPNSAFLNYCDKRCTESTADKAVDDGYAFTSPVGSYKAAKSWANAYDMAGNVWEWTSDWYDPGFYANSPKADPTGPKTGSAHAAHGGSWYDVQLLARSAFRAYFDVSTQRTDLGPVGFRVVVPDAPSR